MTDKHLLIVEDDQEISGSLAKFLHARGFQVSICNSAEAADDILQHGEITLILLDVLLPGESGLALCQRLRASNGPPIIMLTALADPIDKVVGLEVGADDYMSKPVDLRELLARIHAVLRRAPSGSDRSRRPNTELVLRFAGFTFYPHRRFLRAPDDIRIPLTAAETDLLLVLCQNAGKVLSREELINLTRGGELAVATRSVDLLISRLRRKLSTQDYLSELIRTVRSDGYVLQAEVEVE